MKSLLIFVLVYSCLINFSWADTRLIINGKSVHLRYSYYINNTDPSKPSKLYFNEDNKGFGFEYDLPDYKNFKTYLNVGKLTDSYNLPSSYVGVVTTKRFTLTKTIFFDAGINTLIMKKYELRNGKPTPIVLPAFSIGTRDIAINFTYLPPNPNTTRTTDVLFAQLKLKLF